MKFVQIILPALLSQAASAVARAAAVPRQLSHPADPYLNPLAPRQAPSASGPSTLSTAASPSPATPISSSPATPDESDLESDATATSSPTSTSAIPTGPRNHNIAVGQNGTQFTPTALKNITIGDTLTFYFYPANYSIIQSSFESPCVPIKRDGGVDQRAIFSGFHPASNGIAHDKFVVTVQSTATSWIYAVDGTQLATSADKTVCERGMVMVVNAQPKDKAAGETLRTYQKHAAGLDNADVHSCPTNVWGGDIIPLSEKQKANWEGRHPIGGNPPKNGTTSANGTGNGGDDSVLTFQNGAERAMYMYGRGNSLMAIAVFVGACVFGLGM